VKTITYVARRGIFSVCLITRNGQVCSEIICLRSEPLLLTGRRRTRYELYESCVSRPIKYISCVPRCLLNVCQLHPWVSASCESVASLGVCLLCVSTSVGVCFMCVSASLGVCFICVSASLGVCLMCVSCVPTCLLHLRQCVSRCPFHVCHLRPWVPASCVSAASLGVCFMCVR